MARGKPNSYIPCPCGSPFGMPNTRICRQCSNQQRAKYLFTEAMDEQVRETWNLHSRDPKFSNHISALSERLNVPRYAVQERARFLGVVRNRQRPWTDSEKRYVRANFGVLSIYEMARTIGRSEMSVKSFAWRTHTSTIVAPGYTREDIARLLGVGRTTIQKWVDHGYIKPDDIGRFSHAQLELFLRNRLSEIDLRRTDQAWIVETLSTLLQAA